MNKLPLAIIIIFWTLSCSRSPSTELNKDSLLASTYNWEKTALLFDFSGNETWQEDWFLDGTRAKISHSSNGMTFQAGKEYKNDTCHAVLWTKQTFEGNILIEYDYTRTDSSKHGVNILYFLTTGWGNEEFPVDIYAWRDYRKVPTMSKYFRNMHTYHISYATGYGEDPEKDYLRLRRYDPSLQKLKGSEVLPDYFNTGLFKTGVTYRIMVSRYENEIIMKVENISDASDQKTFQWDTSNKPLCHEGRIGLRHMYTRSARYKNLKVWQIE